VKREHPTVPITLYANGSGGLLERLGRTGVDVVGLDWTVDMADARQRLGPNISVQVRPACFTLCAVLCIQFAVLLPCMKCSLYQLFCQCLRRISFLLCSMHAEFSVQTGLTGLDYLMIP
jgi:hypothetical protein